MGDLLRNVVPLLLLIALGYLLRRNGYFSGNEIQALTGFIGDFLVPCVIFNTIFDLDIRSEHLALSIGFFCLLLILLVLSWLVYRILKLPWRSFIFFSCAFSFGLMGIPLFSATFGSEHMEYLVAMGIGHELFFALIYITSAKVLLRHEAVTAASVLRNLASPLFLMVFVSLILNLSGLNTVLAATTIGSCLLSVISQLASITMVLTMLVVGFKIQFLDKRRLGISVLFVLFRYFVTFTVGYGFKFLVLDRLVAPSVYFDHAFFLLLSQFGSTVLIIMVGKYCSREEMEISSNAFVINALVGILLYILYISLYPGLT